MATSGVAPYYAPPVPAEPSEHRVDLSPLASRGFDFRRHQPPDAVDSWVPASKPATWVGAAPALVEDGELMAKVRPTPPGESGCRRVHAGFKRMTSPVS